ncbi:OmpA family protein [Xinfangfangia sp. CPCC 101601]|uniref:OmpA family protein n=2 Tax=Pseudogemmobacter lacusdianii TaxID=3069608 RepID=A0ABU0W085_9RHOB|nr:OmpA family protein [Xinfangfangia sp. CPCC 101601]
MLGVALLAALVIESRSDRAITKALHGAGMEWATSTSDGLQVHLTGTAPDERARFRALNLVGSVVDASRIRDSLDVTPAVALAAPRFSVEMLRNDDGIQLIGLMPEKPEEGGMDETSLVEAATALTPDMEVSNLLEAAAWPAPETWNKALTLGVSALKILKRSKVSVAADRVEITAIAESESEKRRLEAALNAAKPDGVSLLIEISAPRPVLTPFTLRFIKDGSGARFDACAADSVRARTAILRAAEVAGLPEGASCTIGLGVPTPRWAEGATAGIKAVAELENATVTFSDADVTLLADASVSQELFDRVVGELRAALPPVFSLNAQLPKKDVAQGPAEFTAKLSPEGRVELRGRLPDEMQQAAVDAFARASFGASKVYVATRLDNDLPDGWPVRVLAGLEALALLHDGSLLVRADTVEVKGVSGSQDARAGVTRILSGKLGQGATFRVDVSYNKELDPFAALPTPQECAARVSEVMKSQKFTFTPGSAEITSETLPIAAKLAEALKNCVAVPLEIAGHTDSQGSESGNKALSQARAEAVLLALQGRRVDVSQMTAVGYGEAVPIADNGTEAGREENRRIEFVLKGAAPVSADAAPAAVADAPAEGHDFSNDTSASVAPREKTIRPKPRPAAAE